MAIIAIVLRISRQVSAELNLFHLAQREEKQVNNEYFLSYKAQDDEPEDENRGSSP